MSHLNALTICGVRLFSPEENQKVLFSTPVTLFLGRNGCGKTTIIECIRYALTGEIPAGTNNGHGFLNDRDMTHVTKGNVKLKYTDNIGNVITVSRFMQVQKKDDGKMQFRSLDVNIRKHAPDGETNDISGRCVDADNFCCNSLGVSKSILNNVLFCHQENSYWPLDEPKKLKEKFDEIFEAVKYNKYIDFVRKDIKNRKLKIKVFQRKVETRRIIKDEVEKCRAKFEARQIELNEIQNSIQEKSDEIKRLEDRRNEICDLKESIGSLQRNLIQKQTESKGLQGQQGILLKKITLVFEGTDDDLQNRIKSFKQLQQVEEDNIKQLEQKNKEIIAENNTVGVAIQKIQMKIGELKEEQKQHRNKQQKVKVLVEKLRNKLDINRNIDWESTEEIADELESAIQKLEVEYAKLVRDKEEEEKELQNQIDTAREKFVSVRQIRRSKKGLVREYGGKARDIKYQLDQLGSSDSQLKIVGDKIEKLQTTLSSLKSSFSERDKNIEIDKLKGAIDAKEQSLEKLEREHRILQQNYHHEQNLEREIAAVAEKEMEINKIKSKHASNFNLLFDDDTPGSNFKSSVQRIQNEEEAKCKLKPISEEIETLTNRKIPELEEEVKKLEEEYNEKQMELASDKAQLELPQKKVEVCKNVISDATLLDRYIDEIKSSKENIEKYRSQIVTVPSERSREEAEAEIDAGKAELSNLKHQYESCKKMLDQHRERCQQLNDQIQKETKKQLDIQKLLQERPMLETQLKEFEEKLSALKSELEELEDQVRECNKQLNTAIEERQSVVKKNNKLKNEENLKINANKTLLADIKKLYNAIETYVRNNTEGELDLTVEKLAKLKIKEKDLDDQKNAIIDSISTTKQNLAKKETEYRNLTDNVTLRELKVSEKKLIDEIRDLENNIKGFNYRSLRTEKIEIDKKLEKAHREINTLTGKQEEVERAIKEFQVDLKKPEKKDAYKNYLKQYHELVVEEHMVEDLGTYINVLEKCVLKFLEDRMVHINRIIKELWRETYKGNDIDYIEIQTNEDMQGGGLNKRRTYNYKVVQVENTIELEMRGRCSAGQKVLACLIIRIALAEAFSSHCRILALDEPTTYLDKKNIISLSDTLANLVLAKNFQLLVLTHNEEFLSGLTRSLDTDGYWEVKRNRSGFSTVERRIL
ncbi:unnamed protein product [Acanthoscelides obtectus]|uniref:Rad50/SbcC-type AAA domain-containing protein n=1 Tax=Acanthoscelides obtectus TaxID=200917 RepID=A0A9P0KMJ4_ACAOB|nr:unnamed protein product [Acanthoscelides obtectus]CAK1666633.1 DNA repair protein RAD50 [Acanthoscelides obtectus]